MKSSHPLVSVYLPTLNRMALVKRAIDSVLSQTYKEIELIVVDDGSSDGTLDYLSTLSRQDSRVTFLTKNDDILRGAPASRNLAIRSASGEFVTGLDDDDYFVHNRIEYLLKHYDSSFSAIASNCVAIRRNYQTVTSVCPRIITREVLFNRNVVGPQALIERSRVMAIGGYDESLKALQDWDLWLRLTQAFGPIKRVGKRLYVSDVSHGLERISLSPEEGRRQFLLKYQHEMTLEQQNFLRREKAPNAWKGLLNSRKFGLRINCERLRKRLKIA